MAVYNLLRGLGPGPKMEVTSASITGTGSISANVEKVNYAFPAVQNSGTSIPTRTASVTSISGSTINIVVTEHQAAANAVPTTASTVAVIIIKSES